MAGDGSGSIGTRMYVGCICELVARYEIYIVTYAGICLIHPK